MGRGIGTRLEAGGNDVEVIDTDPARAETLARESSGYAARRQSRHRHANRVDFETMEGLTTPLDSSSAEETAKLVPDGTAVVKAFNTTFGHTLVAREVAGEQLEVLIAGDDENAKKAVAELRGRPMRSDDRPRACGASVGG